MYVRFLCGTPSPVGCCILIIALKNIFNKLEHLIIIGKALKDSEFLLWAVFVQLLIGLFLCLQEDTKTINYIYLFLTCFIALIITKY